MKKINIFIVVLLSLLLFSCATDTGVSKHVYTLNQNLLKDGKTAQVVANIAGSRGDYNDAVLYYMDLGFAKFYNGEYLDAADMLDCAEDAIAEYSVQSVSENLSALLKNDYSIAYPGEKYEEVLVDTFAAIAYEMAGDSEAAMVEVRQADIKLTDYKYNAEEQESGLEKLVLAITPDPFRYLEVESVSDFTGSAIVDYMSMIMYRGNGDLSNAEVDYRRIQNKLSDPTVVTTDEIEIPSGMARVNLISFEGLIGSKTALSAWGVTRSLLTGNTVTHKISWPWFEVNESEVVNVTLYCSNGQSVSAKQIEDFNEMAKETLAMDVKSTYLKSFYRGYTKMNTTMTAAQTAYDAAMKAADSAYQSVASNGNPLATLAAAAAKRGAEELAKKAYNEALEAVNNTEIADTRMAQFLPARASVAGLTLEPGVYDFRIMYTLRDGRVITKEYNSYTVEAGKTNLLLGTCAN